MSKYIHFTEEQKRQANLVNLEIFLQYQGETLLPSGREKRLKSDHSITIRENRWYDHQTETGGFAVDFLQNFYGMTFQEAMISLLSENSGLIYCSAKQLTDDDSSEKIKSFVLPPKNNNMKRVYAYLTKSRHIDLEVINYFVKQGMLYESCEESKDKTKKYYNAVFVGYDENKKAVHAHKRGLYTQGKGFKGNIEESNPSYSFHCTGTSNILYAFEAPIDMLSFITIHKDKDWKKHSYISLCGLSKQAIFKTLQLNENLDIVVLCLDNDSAGIEAREKFYDILSDKSILPDRKITCKSLFPICKDWNEDIKKSLKLSYIPSQKHPQHAVKKEIYERISEAVKEADTKNIFDNLMKLSEEERIQIIKNMLNKLNKEDKKRTAEKLKKLSAFFLFCAEKEYMKTEDKLSMEDLARLYKGFKAYENRSKGDRVKEVKKELLKLEDTITAKIGNELEIVQNNEIALGLPNADMRADENTAVKYSEEAKRIASAYEKLSQTCFRGAIAYEVQLLNMEHQPEKEMSLILG